MKLKTFKTNWPLCNPVNILSCLTKTEKAIKGKYQKKSVPGFLCGNMIYTPPNFPIRRQKIWQMIIHQQPAQPRNLQFCIKPELGIETYPFLGLPVKTTISIVSPY